MDGRGGKRQGAGRKPSGKSKFQFWITQEEADLLKEELVRIRTPKKPAWYEKKEEKND